MKGSTLGPSGTFDELTVRIEYSGTVADIPFVTSGVFNTVVTRAAFDAGGD